MGCSRKRRKKPVIPTFGDPKDQVQLKIAYEIEVQEVWNSNIKY
jgi:hypothetical protein